MQALGAFVYMGAAPMYGRRDALEALWKAYGRRVYLTAFRILRDPHDADEVCTEAFKRYLEVAPHPVDEMERRGPGYLLVTARHLAISMLRGRRVNDEPSEDLADTGAAVDRQVDTLKLARDLRNAIDRLSPRRREIFEMRFLEGFSYADIGVKLGMREGTTRKNVYDTCRSLRAHLEPWWDARKDKR